MQFKQLELISQLKHRKMKEGKVRKEKSKGKDFISAMSLPITNIMALMSKIVSQCICEKEGRKALDVYVAIGDAKKKKKKKKKCAPLQGPRCGVGIASSTVWLPIVINLINLTFYLCSCPHSSISAYRSTLHSAQFIDPQLVPINVDIFLLWTSKRPSPLF